MPTDAVPAIAIAGLTKTYPDGHAALTGLDLELDGGMFGLLGPNGAGKTTFLSILVMALEPTAGEVRILGLDPREPSNRRSIRAQLGYLPQDFEPIGALSGFEYLLHCARLRGLALAPRLLADHARQLLSAVDLLQAADRRSGDYSGGMKRRLGIAQALIHNPKILVVDEPTAGLDPEERIRFRNLIADAADETTVLLSTHIVEDIEATCPRIGIIARGRMLFDGEPQHLLAGADGKLWRLPNGTAPPPGAAIVARTVAGAEATVVWSDEPIADAIPHAPNLEEAYSAYLATLPGGAVAP